MRRGGRWVGKPAIWGHKVSFSQYIFLNVGETKSPSTGAALSNKGRIQNQNAIDNGD